MATLAGPIVLNAEALKKNASPICFASRIMDIFRLNKMINNREPPFVSIFVKATLFDMDLENLDC